MCNCWLTLITLFSLWQCFSFQSTYTHHWVLPQEYYSTCMCSWINSSSIRYYTFLKLNPLQGDHNSQKLCDVCEQWENLPTAHVQRPNHLMQLIPFRDWSLTVVALQFKFTSSLWWYWFYHLILLDVLRSCLLV